MNRDQEHLDLEVLNDYVDEKLDHTAAGRVREHLARCSTCSSQYSALQGLLKGVSELPRSVLPPEDLWPGLRDELNSRKDLVLPTVATLADSDTGSIGRRGVSRRFVAILAAAAVVLIVLSSGITALVLRPRSDLPIAVQPPRPSPVDPGMGASRLLSVRFQQTEDEYTRTIAELKLAVDTQRAQLSPETIRTVDHSLAVVDSAIAEARAALMADPNNEMLVDLLSSSYQRKLDLLRRTSELGSKT